MTVRFRVPGAPSYGKHHTLLPPSASSPEGQLPQQPTWLSLTSRQLQIPIIIFAVDVATNTPPQLNYVLGGYVQKWRRRLARLFLILIEDNSNLSKRGDKNLDKNKELFRGRVIRLPSITVLPWSRSCGRWLLLNHGRAGIETMAQRPLITRVIKTVSGLFCAYDLAHYSRHDWRHCCEVGSQAALPGELWAAVPQTVSYGAEYPALLSDSLPLTCRRVCDLLTR